MPIRERVLFIGNSYTHDNELPKVLARLVASIGDGSSLETEMVTAGGWTLDQHWKDARSRELLARGWDRVVLQEQTRRPFEHREAYHAAVTRFDAAIRELGAETTLYLTWAPGNEPERQRELDDSIRAIGRKLKAPVVPAGPAFARVRASHPDLPLYSADGRHPNSRGTYLAACAFLGVIAGRSAVGLGRESLVQHGANRPTVTEIDPAEAAILQKAAWAAVRAKR